MHLKLRNEKLLYLKVKRTHRKTIKIWQKRKLPNIPRKLYKTWFSKEHSIWHKISEFLIEMCIIVFAVTISIWFHNLSEHRHQQEEVKQFLEGLKADLDTGY